MWPWYIGRRNEPILSVYIGLRRVVEIHEVLGCGDVVDGDEANVGNVCLFDYPCICSINHINL